MTEQMKQAIEKAGEQICDMVGTWSEYLTEPALGELTAILTELVEEVQGKSAWELFKKIYAKHRYRLRIKIHKKIHEGQRSCYRPGSETLETWIIENTEQEAIEMMHQIEKELEAGK